MIKDGRSTLKSSLSIGSAIGEYIVQEALTNSPIGDYCFGFHYSTNAPVMICQLSSLLHQDQLLFQQFQNDLKRLQIIKHPSIAELEKSFEFENNFFYVLKLPENGKTIFEVLKSGEVLEENTAVSVVLSIAETLNDVWQIFGLVHSSLRPENIFVTPDNNVLILNFGLEESINKSTRSTVDSAENLGRTLEINRYKAHDKVKNTIKSDIYSLGICFYEMLTCGEPFEFDDKEIVSHLIHDDVDKNNLLEDSGISSPSIALISKMIAIDPERRPSKWHFIIEELAKIANPGKFKTTTIRKSMKSKLANEEIIIESEPKKGSLLMLILVVFVMVMISLLISVYLANSFFID